MLLKGALSCENFNDVLSFKVHRYLNKKRLVYTSLVWLVGRWRQANSSPVCFGAKNHQFGRFYAPKGGRLAAIKLVHLYGYVSSDTGKVCQWSYWGCGYDEINVVVTTKSNHVLFPPSQFIKSSTKWSKIIGYNSWSPELVLSVFSHPYWVSSGQELRLWYGEDFVNLSEGDNGGRACCDVYALFVWRGLL